MKKRSFLLRLFLSPLSCCTAILLLTTLAWSDPPEGGMSWDATKGQYVSIVVTILPSDAKVDDLYQTQITLGVTHIEFDNTGRVILVSGVNHKIEGWDDEYPHVISTEKLIAKNGVVEFKLDDGYILALPIDASFKCRVQNADVLLTAKPNGAALEKAASQPSTKPVKEKSIEYDLIHYVAAGGDLAEVKALVESDPRLINREDIVGATPLYFAARNGHKEVAEFLLSNNAKINAKTTYGYTALHCVAVRGHKDVAALLLTKGADVEATDKFGETPLQLAAKTGHMEVAELLLTNKANINAMDNVGRTPLRSATFADHKDVVELLLTKGADVGAKDKYGQTPLHVAGHKDVAELLLAKGADVNAKGNGDITPLHHAARDGYKDVVELLLANNADVNAKDLSGWTPLHSAALGGQKDVVELLLANGADVNAKAGHGETPLFIAIGNEEVGELLRQHGGHLP